MHDARLPRAIEEFLLDVAADPSQRQWRRHLLGFNGDRAMRDDFIQALAYGMTVHADVCEDDPCEIVVRASGTGPGGVEWRGANILLLEPSWAGTSDSQDLADDIVANWERLGAFVREHA